MSSECATGSPIPGGKKERVRSTVRDALDGPLYLLATYSGDTFDTLHVHETLADRFESRDEMQERLEGLHSYIKLDTLEHDLFQDHYLPLGSDVRYASTSTDRLKLVRLYADSGGLFLVLDRDAPVRRVVDRLDGLLKQ